MQRTASAGVWPSVVSRMTRSGLPSERRRAGRVCGGISSGYSGGLLPRGLKPDDPKPTAKIRRHQKRASKPPPLLRKGGGITDPFFPP